MRINASADLSKAREQGRFGIIFGLQNGAQFESLDAVDRCYMDGSAFRSFATTSGLQ
jgi:microsomal dipeptidase-like Zn-dependent dipeptidase